MKVAVLCSGGVDSSVALALLRKQGIPVTAIYLKIWMEEDLDSKTECPWEEDLEYLERTCSFLQVDLHIVPLQREYYERIVQELFLDLKNGFTSNPDVLCNERIKFGAYLMEKMKDEYTHIASGHYASVEKFEFLKNPPTDIFPHTMSSSATREKIVLKKGKDTQKDQTYFLSYLKQVQLQRILFPLWNMTKSEVRFFARRQRLPACDRKDSQGLCFIGKINFRNFVAENLGKRKGNIIDWDSGKIIGEHCGHWFYTIGQRSGLGLSGGPYFVVHREIKENFVYVSRNPISDSLVSDRFSVTKMNWILGAAPRFLQEDSARARSSALTVRIRHVGASIPCRIEISGNEENMFRVFLAEKDAGITSGQVAVFYDGDVCLGGGMIVTDQKNPGSPSSPISIDREQNVISPKGETTRK